MKTDKQYCVALFDSVNHVMKAEKILKGAGIQYKLIPVPRHISSDCGVCLRFLPEQKDAVIEVLESRIHINEICELLQ